MMKFWRAWRIWSQEHGKGVYDLLALLVACALCFGLILYAGFGKYFLELMRRHPAWRLEELSLGLAFSWFFLILFAWRRWDEAASLLTDAGTDALTGLYNRRKTQRVLNQELERSRRYGIPLTVVMFDVDHFKHVNDTFGHPVGDIVLVTIARRIRRKMRTTDHLGRWGGEEFLLICPETDLAGAVRIADRMRRTIKRRPMQKAGNITASFGVASFNPDDHPDAETLVAEADQYLYKGKEAGRDCVFSRLGKAQNLAVPAQLSRLSTLSGETRSVRRTRRE